MSASIRATYRVQLHGGFRFADAGAMAAYLRDLGISHLYCSPVLAAAPASTHGYDVVDPQRLDDDRGGRAGFDAMVRSLVSAGIRLVLDIVPNHMAMAGRANVAWWDVLARGPESTFAEWFDVRWHDAGGIAQIALPVLGDHLARLIDAGAVTLRSDGDGFVADVAGHVVPVRACSVGERRDAPFDDVLAAQHYRLATWRAANELCDHRRFFDVTALVGIRVEEPDVFRATHSLIGELVRHEAPVDELRVDHVDGLRRPGEYLDRLAQLVAPADVVVEKILLGDEVLPESWPVAGTSGYDFLTRVNHLFVDESNVDALTAGWVDFTGDEASFDEVARVARRHITDHVLVAEVERLVDLVAPLCAAHRRHRDHTRRQLSDALCEVLAAMPVYRTYVHPGEVVSDVDRTVVRTAVQAAAARRPDVDAELLELIGSALVGDAAGAGELAERFAQVSSAVMAKGVEDTAFYRYHRLVSLNEVGGDPGRIGDPVTEFHRHNAHVAQCWPRTMLTLSTHDTKRSADVRARINVLSELPGPWAAALQRWSAELDRAGHVGNPDRRMRYLLFQTLVGTWPINAERFVAFARKAAREAKLHTSWVAPDARYEAALERAAVGAVEEPRVVRVVEELLGEHDIVQRAAITSLAQTALLLTAPGVPDLYQGSEVLDLSLVDPDNRRPVDVSALHARLRGAIGWSARDAVRHMAGGGAKQWLVHRLLASGDAAGGDGYAPLAVDGSAARHVVAYRCGDRVTVVPRLTDAFPWSGWGSTHVQLPAGRWTDVLTGASRRGGASPVGEVLEGFPVAVLSTGAA